MPVNIFFCYAHEDEELLKKLKVALRPLQRQGLIDVWYDRDISAGAAWEHEIDKNLNTADIILLLVSPDFMNSDYSYSVEMKRALERHDRGEAQVIPIILRPVYLKGTPFSKLQALPTDEKPLTTWRNRDEAFFNIVDGIRTSLAELTEKVAFSSAKDDLSAISKLKKPTLDHALEPASYPQVAGSYTGTAYNKIANANADITFTVKQIQEDISGYLKILTPGWIGSGYFEGTIDTLGNLKFQVKDESGKSTILGEGIVYPDQSIGGVYTMPGYLDLGTWHIKRV
jgi:hypothetical protein